MAPFHRLIEAAQKGDPRARKMLEHMSKAIHKVLGDGKKAGAKKKKMAAMAKKKKFAMAKAKAAYAATIQLGVTQPKIYVAKVRDGQVELAVKRRAAAAKLMKLESHAELRGDIERARRVAELRAHAIKLQKEIEQLRRELAK